MHLRIAIVLALCAALALPGCLEVRNMPELKAALGVEPEEALPPAPPVARAMAFPTAVRVGEEVYFTAAGSADPEGQDLAYLWSFNDGARAVGPEARHAFATPGHYRVELTVSDPDGLWSVAGVGVDVRALDLPPTARIDVRDAKGAPATRTLVDAALALTAVASDPEGGPLEFRWDLGDGRHSTEGVARHAWTAPGRYTVALTVTDMLGQANRTATTVAVDLRERTAGVLAAGDPAASLAFPGGPARSLVAAVSYDAAVGADVVLRVLDAEGAVLAESVAVPPVGHSGAFEERVEVPEAALAEAEPGAWRVVVERAGGVRVAYSLALDLAY